MSNANAPANPLSVEDVIITDVIGGGTRGVIEEPSREKSKEEAGTQAKAEKKSKKGHKYFISVLGRQLKKSKPFKLTWKIIGGIGKAMRIAGRSGKHVFVAHHNRSEKSKEGTNVKPEKKSKKGRQKYLLISVLGRHLKKSKAFKLPRKILGGIGKAIRKVGRTTVNQLLPQLFVYSVGAIRIILLAVWIIIIGIPFIIITVYCLCSLCSCLDSAGERLCDPCTTCCGGTITVIDAM